MPLMWQEKSLQMEWCIDCHRNPERYVRPRSAVFSVDYVAARQSGGARHAAGRRSTRSRSSPAARRAIDDRECFLWRTLDERAGDPAFRERLLQRVSLPDRRDHGSGRASDVPEADGRVAGARGRRPRARGSRPKRSSLTSASPRSSSRADRSSTRPRCRSAASRPGCSSKATRAGRRRSRATPLHPGSLGATDAFAQAAVLGLYDPDRSQTLTNVGEIRPWSAFLGAIRAALAAQQPLAGARPPHPDRVGQLADAGRADPRAPGTLSVRHLASVGSGQPRERARRRKARVRRVRRRAVPLRSRRRHPHARRRLSRLRTRRPSLRARLRRAAAA